MARPRDKYPRTWHLTVSPGVHRDDRQHANDAGFVDIDVVITEKLDGSGVSLHDDGVYARSKVGAPNHPSFDPLKALHAAVAWQIPANLSVFGEWCHAVHTIRYPHLPTDDELYVFAVRDDDTGMFWPWDDVAALAGSLQLPTVPVLFTGRFGTLANLHGTIAGLAGQPSVFGPDREGVVVRQVAGFPAAEFPARVGKWVRAGHVAGQHWRRFDVRRHQER